MSDTRDPSTDQPLPMPTGETPVVDWYADVMAFHERFGCVIGRNGPAVPDAGTAKLRAALLTEETIETVEAMARDDLPGIADGVVDLIYVALGLIVSYGIDPRPIWDAVHAANMAKVGGATRADGKVMKPPGWVGPDVAGLIARQQDGKR